MLRTLANALCVATIAVGAGFLTTDAQVAESPYPAYDRCMTWCMGPGGHSFAYCHEICKPYLGPVPVEPAEPGEPDAN